MQIYKRHTQKLLFNSLTDKVASKNAQPVQKILKDTQECWNEFTGRQKLVSIHGQQSSACPPDTVSISIGIL